LPPAVAALAATAALLAASGPASDALAAAPPSPGGVRLRADRIACDATTGRCRLEGRVVLQRGEVSIRADRATWTPDPGTVDAEGNVLLVDRSRVVSAEALHAVMGGDYEAREVIAWLKDGPVRLEDAEARGGGAVGRNRLRLSGRTLSGSGEGAFHLEGARVTVCDCPEGAAPSWELRAEHAKVEAGEAAELSWPVLWITPRFLFVDRPVPVFAFPWLSLPLSDRRSGLLMPSFSRTGSAGTTFSVPVYFTLGRSADATLTAKYATGTTAKVRGPGGSLELRWAPAADAAGQLDVSFLQDLEDESSSTSAGIDGARIGIRLEHAQRFSPGLTLRLDAALSDDPLYVWDLDPDHFGRSAFYRRSEALLTAGGDAIEADLFLGYHLALAPQDSVGVAASEALIAGYGPFAGDLPVFHRWPSLSAMLLPASLGPVLVSARAGIARFAPVHGDTSDSGADGLGPGDRFWTPESAPTEELDGHWNAGERLAVTRADARAEISVPLRLGRFALLEPWVRGAALGYLYDAALDPGANAWGVAGATLASEVSREYGALQHAIGARAEWRMGSGLLGTAPQVASYDQWDRLAIEPMVVSGGVGSAYLPTRRVLRAAPAGTFDQLRVALETRLSRGPLDLLRLAVGQDLDLGAGRAAETWFSALATLSPLVLDVRGRMDLITPRDHPVPAWASTEVPSWLDAFTELHLGAALQDARGDAVALGLLALGPGASGDLVAGVDALFDPQAAPVEAVSNGSFTVRTVLGPATIQYQAQFPGRPIADYATGCGVHSVRPLEVTHHALRMEWSSPCRCFRASVSFSLDYCGNFGWSASIDLSKPPAR
jgi:LPS-assembly protein